MTFQYSMKRIAAWTMIFLTTMHSIFQPTVFAVDVLYDQIVGEQAPEETLQQQDRTTLADMQAESDTVVVSTIKGTAKKKEAVQQNHIPSEEESSESSQEEPEAQQSQGCIPSVEICNDLDDDCDGLIDEGLNC